MASSELSRSQPRVIPISIRNASHYVNAVSFLVPTKKQHQIGAQDDESGPSSSRSPEEDNVRKENEIAGRIEQSQQITGTSRHVPDSLAEMPEEDFESSYVPVQIPPRANDGSQNQEVQSLLAERPINDRQRIDSTPTIGKFKSDFLRNQA